MSKKNNQSPFQAMALTSMIVSQLAGGTLVGIFLGRWIDQKLHTTPLFLIIMLFIGLAAGVFGTVQIVKKYTGEE